MTARPVLIVTDAVAHRDKTDLDALLTALKTRVVEAAAKGWDVRLQYAEEDGSEQTLAKVRHADAVVILGGEMSPPSFTEEKAPTRMKGDTGVEPTTRTWRSFDMRWKWESPCWEFAGACS